MAEFDPQGRGLVPPEAQEIVETLGALKDEVVAAAKNVGEKLELERRIDENPLAVLGVAAGAGFLLGGGLWPLLKPIVKGVSRSLLSPSNLVAVIGAIGAMQAQ